MKSASPPQCHLLFLTPRVAPILPPPRERQCRWWGRVRRLPAKLGLEMSLSLGGGCCDLGETRGGSSSCPLAEQKAREGRWQCYSTLRRTAPWGVCRQEASLGSNRSFSEPGCWVVSGQEGRTKVEQGSAGRRVGGGGTVAGRRGVSAKVWRHWAWVGWEGLHARLGRGGHLTLQAEMTPPSTDPKSQVASRRGPPQGHSPSLCVWGSRTCGPHAPLPKGWPFGTHLQTHGLFLS